MLGARQKSSSASPLPCVWVGEQLGELLGRGRPSSCPRRSGPAPKRGEGGLEDSSGSVYSHSGSSGPCPPMLAQAEGERRRAGVCGREAGRPRVSARARTGEQRGIPPPGRPDPAVPAGEPERPGTSPVDLALRRRWEARRPGP